MKVRIIKSEHCPFCKQYLKKLDDVGFEYETYDGDAEKNDTQLDEWDVDEMPVIQIINDKGDLIYQLPYSAGGYSPKYIKRKMRELSNDN